MFLLDVGHRIDQFCYVHVLVQLFVTLIDSVQSGSCFFLLYVHKLSSRQYDFLYRAALPLLIPYLVVFHLWIRPNLISVQIALDPPRSLHALAYL